jgi:hypothetical protein
MVVTKFNESKKVENKDNHIKWLLEFLNSLEGCLECKCWENPNKKAAFKDLYYEAKFKKGTISGTVECKFDRYKTPNFVSELFGSVSSYLIEENKDVSFLKKATESKNKTVRYGRHSAEFDLLWQFVKNHIGHIGANIGLGLAPDSKLSKSLIFAYCMIKLNKIFYWKGHKIRDYTTACFNDKKFDIICTQTTKYGRNWYSINALLKREKVIDKKYLIGEYSI